VRSVNDRHFFVTLEKSDVAFAARGFSAESFIVHQDYSAVAIALLQIKRSAQTGGNTMKSILLGTIGLVAMAAPALAADLPVKAPPPYVPPMYNWSGFYIGGNGGWGMSENCWNVITPAGAVFVDGCHDKSGGIVGGQIGYRWQLPNNHFVAGVEAQGDWADLNKSHISFFDPTLTLGGKVDGLGLFTGQFGFAADTWLWYLKAGGAVTNNTFTVSSTIGGIGLASASSTRWGGVLGTGFEYGFTPNWSVGVEYDHLFMGSADYAFPVANPILIGAFNRISQDVDMVTVRVNYRFNWGAPLVGNY
jgi:outer membrane immunogenic protein